MTSFTFRRQFILVALLIGFALLWHPLGIAAAPVLIDDFSAGPQTHTLTCCAATESSFAAAGLGGERDIETSLTGGSSGIQYVAASPATSSFQHIQTDTITGQTTVVWDGVDGSTAVDPIGLGGVDFTGGGSNTGLLVYINSASGSINLDFTAYSNGTDVSTATIALPPTVSNQSFSIPFASFSVQSGAGADFTNIGAFVMDIDGSSPGLLQLSLNSLALIGYDFGDLPTAYNITTVADDGARHEIGTLYLGTAVDGETDGQESANADGDDTNGLADEDSVTPVGTWVEGLNGGTVDVIASGAGCLSGWIDWDSNNNFTNFGDDVIVMTEVTAGTNTISFNIPAGGASSSVFSRFRLVPDTGTTPDCSDDTPVALTGYAANGEVEDHLLTPLFVGLSINNVTVDEFTPTATFTVTLDAIADVDVSVNYMTNDGTATAPGDYVAASGMLTITAGITNTTVSITINPDLLDELDETFTVNLSNAVNASIADGQGVGTIVDDDIPPTAVNDAYVTDEDVVLTIAAPGVLGNDINPGVGITFTAILVANPSNGAVSLSSDGSFVYTPTVNFFGNDSFTYRAYDGNNNSNIGTVTIDVLPINDAPIAVDDQATTTENTQAIILRLGVVPRSGLRTCPEFRYDKTVFRSTKPKRGSVIQMIVVAGVDGSEHTKKVLDAAVTFAGEGHIHLAYVSRPVVYPGAATDMAPVVAMTDTEEIRDSEAAAVWELVGQLPANATAHTLEGSPAHAIVDFAKELDADVIVIGSRGRGALKTLLLGSVSHGVVHASDRNVLIVR